MNGRPELDPKLARLLAEERSASDFPEEKREELFAQISAALSGGGEAGGTAKEAPTPGFKPLATRMAKAGTLLLAGGALGYAIARGLAPTPSSPASARIADVPYDPAPLVASSGPVIAPFPRAEDTATPPLVARPLPATSPRPSAGPPPTKASPPVASESAPRAPTSLALERSLVERGRAAIARHDGLSAIEALTAHQRAFPGGKLAEERDALFVQALALAGRADDARRRAREFELRYPQSVFTARVEATVQELPPQ